MRAGTAQQQQGLASPLGSGQLQPVAPQLGLLGPLPEAVAAQLQLRLDITGSCRLSQQLESVATIAGSATVAKEQLAETTLRGHHSLTRRLLEEMTGKALGTVRLAKAGTVQQPGCQFDR